MDPVTVHREAMIRSFLLPNKQERRLRKPRQVLDDLCHNLPKLLDPRYAISLAPLKTTSAILELLSKVTTSKTAVYLGAWSGSECGEYPLAEAVAEVESAGGAAASIEAGVLIYYVTEAHPKGDPYLLARDEVIRQRTRALLRDMEKDTAKRADRR